MQVNNLPLTICEMLSCFKKYYYKLCFTPLHHLERNYSFVMHSKVREVTQWRTKGGCTWFGLPEVTASREYHEEMKHL